MVVAQKIIHTICRKKQGKYGDMSKAFDRDEWPFLESIMMRMGFPDKFVGSIMACITSIRYYVVVNGEARREGTFHGPKASKSGPSIFHLLFADDSIIFCRATTGDFNGIKTILRLYEDAMGQQINFDKFSILVSPNTIGDTQRLCLGILEVKIFLINYMYMGYLCLWQKIQFGP